MASATFFASIAIHASWLNTSSVPIVLADTPATLATSARTTQPYTYTLYLPIIAGPYAWHLQLPPLITPWTYDVSPANARPEYPRPQMMRDQWLNLNGEWQFASGKVYLKPPFSQTLPETILVPYPVESALSGIMRHEETAWYRRSFVVPDEWIGRRILLNFDAVDWQAQVFVNQQAVGLHHGGYDAFSFDITDQLISGPNELIVAVYDPTNNGNQPLGKQRLQPQSNWHTAVSGIWQTVWLEPVSPAHLTGLTLIPDIDHQRLRLAVHGEGIVTETVEALASIGGTPIGSVTGPASVFLEIPIPDQHLWSPDDPFLYDLQVKLIGDSGAIDQVSSYFGMRKISLATIGGYTRATLNNRFVFQMGVIDQGYWPDGLYTAPTDEALRFDIEQAKALGYNVIRKHAKIEPQRWYYWADKLGMLVWQDIPSMLDTRPPSPHDQLEFEAELREMIDQHGNAPSIVTWVAFNSGWGQYGTGYIANLIKMRDPTRLVDAASGGPDEGVGDVSDRHHVVKPIAPPPTAYRLSATGEFGRLGLRINGHTWSSTQGYAAEWQTDGTALRQRYLGLEQDVQSLMLLSGLSAAIDAQLVDVEDDLTGWQTYDRALLKTAAEPIRSMNQHLIVSSGNLSAPSHTGHWPLDEGSGLLAHDVISGNTALLINGPQWTTGVIAGALHFDGLNQYASVGRSLVDTGHDFTVAAWVKLDALNDNYTLISQDGVKVSSFLLHYSASAHRFAFTFTESDTIDPIIRRVLVPLQPKTGAWYYVTGVYDSIHHLIKIYLNGSLVGAATYKTAWRAVGPTVIGRAKWDGVWAQYMRGTIDDPYVADRALSAEEVQALYAAGLRR